MSLIAWYPLNGTLEDYSGNGNNATNVNATIDNSGKIGKCYMLNGSNYIKTGAGAGLKSDNLTISLWAKVNTVENDKILFGTENGTNQRIYIGIKSGKWSIGYGSNLWDDPPANSTSVVQNKWTHIAYVSNGTNACIYIDGIKMQSKNVSNSFILNSNIFLGNNGSTTYNIKASYNDVRIYNEVLSLKEIKEIAKAKILHYNFNEYKQTAKNLFTASQQIFEGWSKHQGATVEITQNQSLPECNTTKATKIKTTGGTSTVKYYLSLRSSSGYAGLTCSASVKVKNIGTTSCKINTQYGSVTLKPQEFVHFKNVGTIKANSSNYQLHFEALTADENIEVLAFEPMWEDNDNCSDYTSSIREDYITDSSGFRNHSQKLELTSTPQWIEDSVIGRGCYKFTKDKYQRISQSTTIGGLESYTASVWVNMTDFSINEGLGTIMSISQDGSTYPLSIFIIENGKIQINSFSSTLNNVQLSAITLNKWVHIVASSTKGGKTCVYVDGVKQAEYTNAGTAIPTNAKVHIGDLRADRKLGINGKIDDIRLYATALSDEDIKELYQSRGSLCKNGKIITNEIVERVNYAYKMNNQINLKQFGNGLTQYEQAHCKVTITDEGARIYRTPNLTQATDGNVMWGGLRLQFPEGTFEKGRKYKLSFKAKGQTYNSMTSPYLTPQMGWTAGGLTSLSYESGKNIPANFNSSSYQEFYYIFNLTSFNVYQTATKTESIFTQGISYNCCRDLALGFGYGSTGTLGTDLYIKDIMLIDITEGESSNITKKGQFVSSEIIEQPTVNLETKTAYNADWVQLFYHNNKSGTVLFSSDKNEFLKCNTTDKKSNLYLLELFRGKDGKFEFLLEYESGSTSYNRWKQTSNFTSEPISGYEAIQCSWTTNAWGGLAPSSTSGSTWVDGSPNADTWYYSIGTKGAWSGGIPAWNSAETGWVKLWVRCDNPSVFKMYKNGCVMATEFVEN